MDHQPAPQVDTPPIPVRLVRRLAASPPGLWATRHHLHRFDLAIHGRTDGRHTLTSLISGLPVAMVRTTGARSGQPRRSPLIVLPTQEGVAVVGSNYGRPKHPGWVHNLRSDPHGSLTVDQESWDFEAVEVEGDRRTAIWNQFVRAWPGYAGYEDRAAPRRIAVFDLRRA